MNKFINRYNRYGVGPFSRRIHRVRVGKQGNNYFATTQRGNNLGRHAPDRQPRGRTRRMAQTANRTKCHTITTINSGTYSRQMFTPTQHIS